RGANAHRSAGARPVAARVAAPVSLMRNGVGNIGSVPPVNSTVRARSSDQLATGKIERRASCGMVDVLPYQAKLYRRECLRHDAPDHAMTKDCSPSDDGAPGPTLLARRLLAAGCRGGAGR